MFENENNSLSYLIDQLHRLPGIGRKTAQRLAFHIIKDNIEDASELAHAILEVKSKIRYCNQCFNITESDKCNICNNPGRDASTICVVEDIVDIIAIEKSNEYQGIYHVLGGAISPLAGISPDDLHIKELLIRSQDADVKEILLAINPSTEGEATMIYLSKLLKPYHKRITRIASGVPFGAHLEFIDNATIGRAILSRRDVE
ncbi:MAG: recombination protein RecR [Calditrichia bacterium]|nr:recombination protein RecR [Calditrichia bacterium]